MPLPALHQIVATPLQLELGRGVLNTSATELRFDDAISNGLDQGLKAPALICASAFHRSASLVHLIPPLSDRLLKSCVHVQVVERTYNSDHGCLVECGISL